MIIRIPHCLCLQELGTVDEIFQWVEPKSKILTAVHSVPTLVVRAFVVCVEGEGLPVAFFGGGDCLVEGAEGGGGLEAEFGDEAGGVVFVVLVGGHFAMPDWMDVLVEGRKEGGGKGIPFQMWVSPTVTSLLVSPP